MTSSDSIQFNPKLYFFFFLFVSIFNDEIDYITSDKEWYFAFGFQTKTKVTWVEMSLATCPGITLRSSNVKLQKGFA